MAVSPARRTAAQAGRDAGRHLPAPTRLWRIAEERLDALANARLGGRWPRQRPMPRLASPSLGRTLSAAGGAPGTPAGLARRHRSRSHAVCATPRSTTRWSVAPDHAERLGPGAVMSGSIRRRTMNWRLKSMTGNGSGPISSSPCLTPWCARVPGCVVDDSDFQNGLELFTGGKGMQTGIHNEISLHPGPHPTRTEQDFELSWLPSSHELLGHVL